MVTPIKPRRCDESKRWNVRLLNPIPQVGMASLSSNGGPTFDKGVPGQGHERFSAFSTNSGTGTEPFRSSLPRPNYIEPRDMAINEMPC